MFDKYFRARLFVTYVFVVMLFLENTSIGDAGSSLQPRECTAVHRHAYEKVVLECKVSSVSVAFWQKDDEQLFASRTPLTFRNNIVISQSNYSIILDPVTPSDDGRYHCKDSGSTLKEYCLYIMSIPNLLIFVNGKHVAQQYEARNNSVLNITCVANAARPAINLTLAVNNEVKMSTTETVPSKFTGNTFDSTSSISHTVKRLHETLSCFVENHAIFNISSSVSVRLFAPPQLHISQNGLLTPEEIYISEGTSIDVTCIARGAKPPVKLYWLIQYNSTSGIICNNCTSIENEDFSASNLSMTFKGTDRLTITCQSWGQSVLQTASKNLTIFVKEMQMLHVTSKGRILLTGKEVCSSDVITVSCKDVENNPFANASLKVITEIVSGSGARSNVTLVKTPTSDIAFFHPRNTIRSWIICEIESKDHLLVESLSLDIYVIPILRIQKGDSNISGVVTINTGETLTLKCKAFSVREKIALFMEMGVTANLSGKYHKNANKHHKGTFDMEMAITLQLSHSEIITCYYKYGNQFGVASVATHVLLGDKKHLNSSWLTRLFSISAVIIIALFAVYITYRRKRGSDNTRIERKTPEETPTVFRKRLTAIEKENQLKRVPPCIDLPDVPKVNEGLYEDTENSNWDDYHELLKKNSKESTIKFVDRQRVFLITKGLPCTSRENWIGTMTSMNGQKQCIYISAPKDTINNRPCLWEIFTRKCFEMPKCTHIATFEGLCIDGDKIYLLQAYTQTEELGRYLSKEAQDSAAFECLFNYRRQFALQLVVAMEFLLSHGFAHPGLSICKVRVTEKNTCLLYDFCLKEEASDAFRVIKQQGTHNFQLYPPESVARNEYCYESDVWCTGLTIWEIFATGIQSNNSIDKSVNSNISPKDLTLPKPTLCPLKIYNILLNCWHFLPSLRPTLSEIRFTIQNEGLSVAADMATSSNVFHTDDTYMSDIYVPMETECS